MSETQTIGSTGQITICSSLAGDRWTDQSGPNAFQRWHFDALSDDGREALVIAFHSNYAFSPRYYAADRSDNGGVGQAEKRFPAICFTYSVDGKTIMHSVNEFRRDEFNAADDPANCEIESSSFRVDTASYGSGFILQIDLLTSRKRRIKAELEWLSIESDLSPPSSENGANSPSWNMVAPRSDVSGRITLIGRRGKTRQMVHFRGTGYHDRLSADRSFEETVGSRYWGRAHFIDATAVFHHHEVEKEAGSKLFLIRDGAIYERDVADLQSSFVRNRHGLKVPARLSLLSADNIRLRVKPVRVIQSGFFDATIACEMTLTLRDGKPRKTLGITELVTPARMGSRFFRWLADMRIGKSGKGPIV